MNPRRWVMTVPDSVEMATAKPIIFAMGEVRDADQQSIVAARLHFKAALAMSALPQARARNQRGKGTSELPVRELMAACFDRYNSNPYDHTCVFRAVLSCEHCAEVIVFSGLTETDDGWTGLHASTINAPPLSYFPRTCTFPDIL
jgi:hypothetical protein